MKDSEPQIEVLGVYRVPYQEQELLDQLRQYYFFGNANREASDTSSRLIETCVPLSLFEVSLDRLDDRFRIADFTQEMPAAKRKQWQAAYDEALLSPNGMQVISRKTHCARGLQTGRVAFYFHYYDPGKPMLWTYGAFTCPAVETVPKRLWDLVPYTPVD